MLLASCSYEEAKKYRNKLVLITEENVKKPEEVLLNIVTDEPDKVLEQGLGKAKCLTSFIRPSICPENYKGNVFHEIPFEEFNGVDEVEGVVALVRLPDNFSDMRKVLELCKVNEEYNDVEAKVRVIGGNLLEIPGVSIGRYDNGKEKMSSVFNGSYDFFSEVKLSDIEVKEVMSKVRSTKSNSKNSIKKPNSKSRKKEALNKFFSFGDSGF